MGLSVMKGGKNSPVAESHSRMYKIFMISNYILLSAASACIFLTLALRLIPSVCGFFLILLFAITILGAVSGGAAATSGSNKWYAAHMVGTALAAIFQGSVSVLIFTQTGEFLGYLKSYVREEDGEVILKMAGGLCLVIFCFEWVVLSLAFMLRYYSFVEATNTTTSSTTTHDDFKTPWPYQV